MTLHSQKAPSLRAKRRRLNNVTFCSLCVKNVRVTSTYQQRFAFMQWVYELKLQLNLFKIIIK